jgi:hypothetical protein
LDQSFLLLRSNLLDLLDQSFLLLRSNLLDLLVLRRDRLARLDP